jgi:hypothetical protein
VPTAETPLQRTPTTPSTINNQQSRIPERHRRGLGSIHVSGVVPGGPPAQERFARFWSINPGAEAVVYEAHRLTSYSPRVRPSAPFAGRASELREKRFPA